MRIIQKLNQKCIIIKAILRHQDPAHSFYLPQEKKTLKFRSKKNCKKLLYISITEGKKEDKSLPLRVSNTLKNFFSYQGIILRVKDQWPHWRGLEIIKEEHNILVILHIYKRMLKNYKNQKDKKKLRERYKQGVDYMLIN